jgi:hypothetical protein
MLLLPLSVIASWPTPNYTNPHTYGPALLIFNTILIALSSIAVSLRLYVRLTITKWFGLDDALIVLAQVRELIFDS